MKGDGLLKYDVIKAVVVSIAGLCIVALPFLYSLNSDAFLAASTASTQEAPIILDAGHGGENPGAISPSGLLEKDVNLDIIMRVRELLHKRGAVTVLTRDGDTGPSMSRRKQIWREGNVDIAVSVHNNAAGSYKVSGTAVLYKHSFDRDLAMCVARRLTQTGLDLFGVVGNFNFSLNAPTFCPNVLVEGMFMSSPEDEERLADPAFRQKVAEKIVRGLEDYLNQCK